MKWSDLSFKEKKQIYDSIKAQNPDTTYLDIKSQFDSIPAYEDGGKRIVDYVNSNNVNFVNRLKNPFRQTINDWETQYINKYVPNVNDKFELVYNSKATHKLSAWEGEEGRGLIVPNVQEINGKLVDFTRPPYNDREALRQAFKTGDFVETDTYNDAEWYTQNYKKYYPSFEDGGKNKKVNPPVELGLTPGTPEYFARQQRISGKADVVQPEVHLTPAGYVKDAMSFAENVAEGNYGEAIVDAALTAIPYGVGKVVSKVKSKLNTPITITKESKKAKVKKESDYDSEFSEVLRRARNIDKYQDEISRTIADATLIDKKTYDLIKGVDNEYGTDYYDAYKRIAYRDMTNRSKYIKFEELPDGVQGKTTGKNISEEIGPTIDNFTITLDPLQYVPGTANHELGHLADQLTGNADNDYLYYLRDMDNVMDYDELLDKGIRISPRHRAYLLDPQESKSHMLHLKRAMLQHGKLNGWSDDLTQEQIEDFLNDARNRVNSMNKIQYDMYRNKSRFVDRMNNLIPMEFAVPLSVSGLLNYNNKEQSN